jgi:ABC-type ATPase with predicted acetyltransferase domain
VAACPNCGTEIKPRAPVCPSCGGMLDALVEIGPGLPLVRIMATGAALITTLLLWWAS